MSPTSPTPSDDAAADADPAAVRIEVMVNQEVDRVAAVLPSDSVGTLSTQEPLDAMTRTAPTASVVTAGPRTMADVSKVAHAKSRRDYRSECMCKNAVVSNVLFGGTDRRPLPRSLSSRSALPSERPARSRRKVLRQARQLCRMWRRAHRCCDRGASSDFGAVVDPHLTVAARGSLITWAEL
jgi:hypothetical protein